MRSALLVALGACNGFYGLESTQVRDAPGPDAAPRCTKGEAPPFSPSFTQAVLDFCNNYTINRGIGLAICGTQGTSRFIEGPVDKEPTTFSLQATVPFSYFESPRLTPDDELIVHQVARLTDTTTASVYRRGAAGWEWARDLPFAFDRVSRVGMPSRAPYRFMITRDNTQIEEAIDDGNGTFTTRTYGPTELGVRAFSPIHLSADGLRAVFTGEGGIVRYAVRDTVAAKFAGSYPLALEETRDAFLTEDCARLYFSGLGSVFYVSQ